MDSISLKKKQQISEIKYENDVKESLKEGEILKQNETGEIIQKEELLKQSESRQPGDESELSGIRYNKLEGLDKLVNSDREEYGRELSLFKKKHEKYMQNNSKLREHKRTFNDDSDKMGIVKDNLQKLSDFFNLKPQAKDIEGLSKELEGLVKVYREVINSCLDYEANRDPFWESGKKRKRMVMESRKQCEEELARLQQLDLEKIPLDRLYSEDFSWEELIFFVSAVHIPGENMEKPDSGNISDVYKVTIDDEKTKSKKTMYFSAERKYKSYDDGEMFLRLANNPEIAEPKSEEARLLTEIANEIANIPEEERREAVWNVQIAFTTTKTDAFKNAVNALPQSLKNAVGNLMTDSSYSYLRNTIGKHIGTDVERVARVVARIGGDKYMSRRNVASSIVAEKLGFNFVAKSKHALVESDGKFIPGNLMEKVEGTSLASMRKKQDFPFEFGYSNSALKDMISMQLFDFICGQTDRHNGNIACQYKDINGINYIKSIGLFDNDMAFGDVTFMDMLYGRRYSYGLMENPDEELNVHNPKEGFAQGGFMQSTYLDDILKRYGINKDDIKSGETTNIYGIANAIRDYYQGGESIIDNLPMDKAILKCVDKRVYDSIMNEDPFFMYMKMRRGCQISVKEAACFFDRFYGLQAYLKKLNDMSGEKGHFLMKDEDWGKVKSLDEVVSNVGLSVFHMNCIIKGQFEMTKNIMK